MGPQIDGDLVFIDFIHIFYYPINIFYTAP